MRFPKYLIKNMNMMEDLLTEAEIDQTKEANNLFKAATLGCRTLRHLSSDKTIQIFLHNLNDMTDKTSLINHIEAGEFDKLNFFLETEKAILKKCNMSETIVDQLIEIGSHYWERNRPDPIQQSPAEVIEELSKQACEVAAILKAHKEDREIREVTKREANKWIQCLGGSAIIGINAFASSTVPPLVTFGAASMAFGATIVRDAIVEAVVVPKMPLVA